MDAPQTTLRAAVVETTSLPRPPHRRLRSIRCTAVNNRTGRICDKMLFRLDGTAQVTCPRCGATCFYSSH